MSDADVFRRVPLEIFNEGRVELIEEIFAPDFVNHVMFPGIGKGRDSVRSIAEALRTAFPDYLCEITHEMHDADLHFNHAKVSGTMTGDFMGKPATGKSATWEEMHVGRMRDGKVVEHWAVIDQLGMLQQLGVIPAQPGA
jgi:predicted ester cyclase